MDELHPFAQEELEEIPPERAGEARLAPPFPRLVGKTACCRTPDFERGKVLPGLHREPSADQYVMQVETVEPGWLGHA